MKKLPDIVVRIFHTHYLDSIKLQSSRNAQLVSQLEPSTSEIELLHASQVDAFFYRHILLRKMKISKSKNFGIISPVSRNFHFPFRKIIKIQIRNNIREYSKYYTIFPKYAIIARKLSHFLNSDTSFSGQSHFLTFFPNSWKKRFSIRLSISPTVEWDDGREAHTLAVPFSQTSSLVHSCHENIVRTCQESESLTNRLALGSAPWCSNSVTASMWPAAAASIKGVVPSWKRRRSSAERPRCETSLRWFD